jgi:prolyl-tRNA editing enzyme YbaK/EbsC (Cys-tRNA(Pro) deacylase)
MISELAMDIEAQVQRALDGFGVAYEVWPCDPELADTALFCAHYGVAPADSANTIIVASKRPKGVYAACVALANTRLDVNRAVKREMGVSRLSFATAEQTMTLTGMLIGGVTPPGLPAEVPILVDAAVMERTRVIIGGGSRSSKIAISPAVFEQMPGARIIRGLATPRTP